MDLQSQAVVGEVPLHLVTVEPENVLVCDGKNATPRLVTLGQAGVMDVEDPIDEGEVVGDLLVAFDVEALGRLRDGCLEVRHVGNGVVELSKEVEMSTINRRERALEEVEV